MEQLTDEEIMALADKAAGYYLGLWNILKKENAPASIIINAAINNMIAVLDFYMSSEQKLAMLETIMQQLKEEESLVGKQQH